MSLTPEQKKMLAELEQYEIERRKKRAYEEEMQQKKQAANPQPLIFSAIYPIPKKKPKAKLHPRRFPERKKLRDLMWEIDEENRVKREQESEAAAKKKAKYIQYQTEHFIHLHHLQIQKDAEHKLSPKS